MVERGDVAGAIVAHWRRAGPALAQVRRRELRALTDEDALMAAETLLDLQRHLPVASGGSGLVEQQRIFSRLRR